MADKFLARLGKALRFTITGANGWMGPGQPLPPSHQELPTRRFDYQVAHNTAFSPAKDNRGREGALPYSQLRNLADNYDLLRAVIEYRKGQIAGATWQVLSPDKDPDAPLNEEEQFATNLLHRPTPGDTWQTWLKKMVEEILVVDSVALYPIVGVQGLPEELRLVDGGTFKKLLSETGEMPMPPEPAYQQIIKGIPMRDFTSDDLILRHMNPRVSQLYGFSPVEQVVMTTLIALRRQNFQLSYYTEGTIPDAIGTVPESWSPEDIRTFQEWFDGALEGSDQRRKMRFVPIDASKVKILKEKDLADKTDEWFARVICFAFGVDPMFLVSMMNRATSETQHDAAHEAGILPIFEWIRAMINEVFDRYGLNVKFTWATTSKIDPKEQAAIDQKDVQLGILSIDEVRKKRGYPPLGVPAMVYTAQGPIPVTAFAKGKNPILEAKQQSGNAKQLAGPGKPAGGAKRPAAAKLLSFYSREDKRSYVDQIKDELSIVESPEAEDE